MTRVRRRLRLLAAAWFVLQAASLSAFPRDCCAAHRPVRIETEHSSHTTVAATECPMRGPDGTPCPMHRGRQSDERRTGTCAMRGTCGEPMAAMVALLANHGVVPDSFEVLRVGPYELTVSQPGFQDATRALTLTVGAAFELPVTLTVGAVDTTVTVIADATVLEAARSRIAGTVAEAEARSLPLNGRNFLELALLVPGVSPTNSASTQLFPETSAVPGVTLSVGSQRNLSNNFIVDGLSANDDAAGLSGITYGMDAIEQFQVIT